MTTWKRKQKLGLTFRAFSAGDTVALAGNPAYKGKIKEYLEFKITPEGNGRVYRVDWTTPTKATSNHFDFELKKIKGRLRLTKRPKN